MTARHVARWLIVFGIVAFVPPALADRAPDTRSTSEPLSSRPLEDRADLSVEGRAPDCRNSYEERCGPFRFDPSPDENADMSVDITVSPSRPRAGQTVTFRVVATDDAVIDQDCVGGDYGDGQIDGRSCSFAVCLEQHGQWTPPPKPLDTVRLVFRHRYEAAGTYDVSFPFLSAERCGNPYADQGSGSISVTVRS